MLRQLRTSLLLLTAMTLLTGLIYPLVVTAIAQSLFSHRANASLIRIGDKAAGSELIGQPFSKPEYFWGRLSSTGPFAYNAALSSGSNLGPLNPALADAATARLTALKGADQSVNNVPIDLITSSGSGLDPHISPAAAKCQIPRVAASRKMSESSVSDVVDKFIESRQWGIFGEPRVNVLLLNRALDQTK